MTTWTTLDELEPGALFVTESGSYAVKSVYRMSSDNPQWRCILLKTGEYAHFKRRNQTRVRVVDVAHLYRVVEALDRLVDEALAEDARGETEKITGDTFLS